MSTPRKIYSRILEQRLRERVEGQLEEELCGFRPNRSTIDYIFIHRQAREKAIEYNKELYLRFIDLEKALGRVLWSALWPILESCGAGLGLVRRIKSFYKNSCNYE